MKNRHLACLGIAESVSNLGNWITGMAVLSGVVFRGTGGVAESSGIWLAGLLPTLVFSPLAGRLCDRFDRVKVMIASQLLSGAAVALLMVVRRFELVLVCLVLQATFSAATTPARQALVPDLAGREHLARANSFLQQLAAVTKIGAPLVGAGAVALAGPRLAVVFDVLSYVLAAGLLSTLPRTAPPLASRVGPGGEPVAKPPAGRALSECWLHPGLRRLFSGSLACVIAITGIDVLLPVYVRDVLGAGEGVMGLLVSCVGLGSAAVGLRLYLQKRPAEPWHGLLWGITLLSVIPLALAAGTLLPSGPVAFATAVAAGLIGGWGNGLVAIQGATLLQQLSPPSRLGQLAGLYQSVVAAGQLAAILGIPLLMPKLLEVGAVLALSGTALLLVALALYLSLRSQVAGDNQLLPVEGGSS